MALVLFLVLQSSPDRWVEALAADRIEDRARAAALLEGLGRDLDDAAALWAFSYADADAKTRLRLGRIRERWRSELRDHLSPEDVRTGAPRRIAILNDEDRQVLVGMRQTRLTIDVTNAPLTAIVDYLREVSGLNIHITGIDNPDNLLLSFHSAEQSMEALLKQMLAPHRLSYSVRDGVLLITSFENLKRQLKMELYDVQELAAGEADGEELIRRIVKRTNPKAWKEDEGRSIQYQNGLLIVRNSRDVHRLVREYLERTRSGRPDEVPREPREATAALFRGLRGPEADEAERRLSLAGAALAAAIRSLADAAESPDLEQRLQSSFLRSKLTRLLGDDRVRRLLETDELQGAVREFRTAWLRDGYIEDFEPMARYAFGVHGLTARQVLKAVVDRKLITPEVGLVLWKGDAVIFVKDGRPHPATMERWLDPDGGSLIFTLPQELGERLAGEGPACVVVERAP